MEYIAGLTTISLSVIVSFYLFRQGARWRVGMILPAAAVLASGIIMDWVAGSLSAERVAVWAIGALGFYILLLVSWFVLRPQLLRRSTDIPW